MFDGRSIEFFEVNKILAMRNLTVFISVLVGSVVVVCTAVNKTLTGEIFGVYMLSCGGIYGFGKWQDEKSKRSQIEADADPATVPQNVTTINQPAAVNVSGDATTATATDIPAKDISIKAEGNVNVNKSKRKKK